ncbi:MAG: response regulator [Chloroflexales bacterium]
MTRILVVEDDSLIREMVSVYLTRFGFEVVTAEDGVQALVLVRRVSPDVILMDMGLPKLNGWQTTQRLRMRQETARIPIIALTAYALESDRQRALNVGCDDFEAKPIDFGKLIAKIQTLLVRAAA